MSVAAMGSGKLSYPAKTPEDLVTIKEAMAQSGLSRSQMFTAIRNKGILPYETGVRKTYLVSMAQVMAYKERVKGIRPAWGDDADEDSQEE